MTRSNAVSRRMAAVVITGAMIGLLSSGCSAAHLRAASTTAGNTAAPSSAPAVSESATAPTPAATPTAATPTAGAPAAGPPAATPIPAAKSNRLENVDWSKVARSAFSCRPQSSQPWDRLQTEVLYQDVTGDGVPDALVTGGCPAATSSNPLLVAVFDGTSDSGSPRVLGVLGSKDYFRTIKITAGRDQIVITGQAIGPQAPLCCPDTDLTLTYTRTAAGFVESGRASKPSR